MASYEELKESVLNVVRKLSHESKRTAFLAKLRMDLKGLDFKKREAYTRLGEKVYDLHKRKAIKDEVLNELLIEQFEELEDIEKKAVDVLEDIQKISLMEYELRASASNPQPQASASDQRASADSSQPEASASDQGKSVNSSELQASASDQGKSVNSSELQASAKENSDDPIST